MSDELSSADPSARDRLTLFLALLASDECRTACHQVLPPDRFAYTWCQLWFNDVYVPSARYLDGLKGDVSKEAVAEFRSRFTDVEMEALERFHRFLELRIEMLPSDLAETQSFPQTDAWDHVVRHAGYALEELERDPSSLKEQVGWIARLIAERSDGDGSALDGLLPSLRDALRRRRLPE